MAVTAFRLASWPTDMTVTVRRLKRKAEPLPPNISSCKHCSLRIEKVAIPRGPGQKLNTWLHSQSSNVWCQTDLVGLTMRFAEPG